MFQETIFVIEEYETITNYPGPYFYSGSVSLFP